MERPIDGSVNVVLKILNMGQGNYGLAPARHRRAEKILGTKMGTKSGGERKK
jgi:hypothetical protein